MLTNRKVKNNYKFMSIEFYTILFSKYRSHKAGGLKNL